MLVYEIRECEPGDVPFLVSLCEKHAQFERVRYVKEGKEALLHAALFRDRPTLFCWVVAIENSLAGYASFTFDFSTWDAQPFLYLDCLFLDNNYRGKGIGEHIMSRLQAHARKSGCKIMQWQTPVFNEKAIGFYNKIGGLASEKVRFSLNLT